MKKLISKTAVGRFKSGGFIRKFLGGGQYYIYTGKYNSKGQPIRKEFQTEAEAQQYRKKYGGGRVQRYNSSPQVLRSDRTQDKSTQGRRNQLEAPYNHLSYKQAYDKAKASGVGLFAYKGKVYKTGNAIKQNEMATYHINYGEKLGWGKSPNINSQKSRRARAGYRREDQAKMEYATEDKNPRPKTNSSVNEAADRTVGNLIPDAADVFDMGYSALMTPVTVSYNMLTGNEWDDHLMQKSGFNPFGWVRGLNKGFKQDDYSEILERGVDAGSWLLGGPLSKIAGKLINRGFTKYAPKLAEGIYTYIPKGGTVTTENGTRVLNAWNQRALGRGNTTQGTRLLGQRSMARAAEEGTLDGLAINGGFNNATRYGTNAVQNVNTGTAYIYKGDAPVLYDRVADATVAATPWATYATTQGINQAVHDATNNEE